MTPPEMQALAKEILAWIVAAEENMIGGMSSEMALSQALGFLMGIRAGLLARAAQVPT